MKIKLLRLRIHLKWLFCRHNWYDIINMFFFLEDPCWNRTTTASGYNITSNEITGGGEVLVNDAETVMDYGGPEALDMAIQQNRPRNRLMGGGIPHRYKAGGCPTRRRFMTGGSPAIAQSAAVAPR